MWESKVNINAVQEIRCHTNLFLGVGAIQTDNDVRDI